METLNLVSEWITRMLDFVLGWLLAMPRDMAVVLIALATSLLLTLARKWTTNQEHLRRCRNDLARLKQLRRQARRAKDKAAAKRMQTTIGMINVTRMKAEGMPLLVSIVPIALLAIWALARLNNFPPQKNELLGVRAYYPVTSVGRLTYVRPPKGAVAVDGLIRRVEASADGQNGEAEWKIRPTENSVELVFGFLNETVEHKFTVGGRIAPAPLMMQKSDQILMTELMLKEAKFLDILPGIPAILFPSWLVAYLILTIMLVPLLRKVLGVC